MRHRIRNTEKRPCKNCDKVHAYLTSSYGFLRNCGTPIHVSDKRPVFNTHQEMWDA